MLALTSLLGGVGLFLLGMWLMTDGLKLAAGGALRAILQGWTNSRGRGLLAGLLITAVVQSSSIVTVATIGFVNAGLLTLAQAVWVIFGANIGSTAIGWLVAMVGVKLDIGALALPLVGVGMLLRLMAGGRVRRAGLGQAIAGFGAFFMGIGVLQDAFADLTPHLGDLGLADTGWLAVPGFVLVGLVITLLTQSSAATVTIVLTAMAGGALPLNLAAAMIVGANVGTTSTALFAMIGGTPTAKRVGLSHVIFNVFTACVVLATLPVVLWAAQAVAALIPGGDDAVETLAVFHTLFSVLGVALIWPLSNLLIRFLSRLFVTQDEALSRPRYLDASLLAVPDLALEGVRREAEGMAALTFTLARDEIAGLTGGAGGHRRGPDPRREAVLNLGQELRDFIDRMSGGALPDTVIAALSHVLRAVQHLEEAAQVSAGIGAPLPAAADSAMGTDWETLRRATLVRLDTDTGEGADLSAEAAYQAVKGDLLRAAASGVLPVAAMETALNRAQALRVLADAAAKARLRLNAAAEIGRGDAPAPIPATMAMQV